MPEGYLDAGNIKSRDSGHVLKRNQAETHFNGTRNWLEGNRHWMLDSKYSDDLARVEEEAQLIYSCGPTSEDQHEG